MNEELRGIISHAITTNPSDLDFNDEYFIQHLKSLIDYFESGGVEGVRYFEKEGKSGFEISYKDESGKRVVSKKNISKKGISQLVDSGYSLEQAFLKLKLSIIVEAVKLRFGTILEINEERKNGLVSNQETIIKFLISRYGGINGISICSGIQYAGVNTFELRVKINGKINSSIKIGMIEKTGEYRSLKEALRIQIPKICEVHGFYVNSETIEKLINMTFPYYYNIYSSNLSDGIREAA